MSIDLERFPWSDSANRMLTYVTKGWYDKSYVGKWIYEVMGRELDLATIPIPVSEDGKYDFQKQKELADKYEQIEEIKRSIAQKILTLSEIIVL